METPNKQTRMHTHLNTRYTHVDKYVYIYNAFCRDIGLGVFVFVYVSLNEPCGQLSLAPSHSSLPPPLSPLPFQPTPNSPVPPPRLHSNANDLRRMEGGWGGRGGRGTTHNPLRFVLPTPVVPTDAAVAALLTSCGSK